MASSQNIVVIRDKARRYSGLTENYADWSPDVKHLVNTADDSDWGTFIAACALLEDVIPKKEQDRIARQIVLDERYDEYVRRAETANHSRRQGSILISIVFSVLVYLIATSTNLQLAAIFYHALPPFTFYGSLLFSIIGSISSGFALGSIADRMESDGWMPLVASAASGFACAIICPIVPPVALILAWAAWRSTDITKPKILEEPTAQTEHRKSHGLRARAHDPRAPRFVKNAIRLAGIYQESSDYIGNIAVATLSERQTNYGAFVIYEALLSDYHAKRRANSKTAASSNNSSDDTDADSPDDSDERHETAVLPNQNERSRNALYGLLTASVIVAMLWLVVDFKILWPTLVGAIRNTIIIGTISTTWLIGLLIGWRSTKRIASIYGLDDRARRISSLLRPAWFSAWSTMAIIIVLYIVSKCIWLL